MAKDIDQPVSLNPVIAYYVSKGYRVISQTETSAQLVKPKKFSLFWGVLLFLVFIVPFVIYLLSYLAKKDQSIYLQIVGNTVVITNASGRTSTLEGTPSKRKLKRASRTRKELALGVAIWFVVFVMVLFLILPLL